MTAASNPSIEELARGCFPGAPPVLIDNPLLAFANGEEFLRTFADAAAGRTPGFILAVEGSVPDERVSGEGSWAALGTDPHTGQPIATVTWIDRLAAQADAVVALGTCAAFGGIPAMRDNPTGAMGLGDHLGAGWRSRTGLPLICVPGCPAQPDNITEVLLEVAMHVAGTAPAPDLDELGRPRRLFGRTVQQGCGRAGYAEHGVYARTPAEHRGCLVKLGCRGPVALCNVPLRGWVGGVGGCPNVGGICIGCTMPSFPDRFQPFMEPARLGLLAARASQASYGPLLRRLRTQAIRRHYDREPDWRGPGATLRSGYAPPWVSDGPAHR